MVFSFVQEMSFETKEGNECIVRNYRELQVIYHTLCPTTWTTSRFLFLCTVQQLCCGQHQSTDSGDSVRTIILPLVGFSGVVCVQAENNRYIGLGEA